MISAELERRTGIFCAKLRRIKKFGFMDLPHALIGCKAEHTFLTGLTGIIAIVSCLPMSNMIK